MAAFSKKFEVEDKYRTRKNAFGPLAVSLRERGFSEKRLVQTDHHIRPLEKGRNRRVRKQQSESTVVYFLTDKRRVEGSDNTRHEDERNISVHSFAAYTRLTLQNSGVRSIVYKKRIQFDGTFQGRNVSVCLDDVTAEDGFRIGFFVEFECLVEDSADIEATRQLLSKLATSLLPGKRPRREVRSYRRLARIAARKIHKLRQSAA
jgi:adenylate cyclase class IV